MKKKLDRRVARSKKNIKTAFVTLMSKKEITQITVTELSALADIDRKTFYLHYDTVEDVYKEIVHEVSNELNILINDHDFSFPAFFHGLNRIMENDLQFYKVIVKNNSYSFLLNECVELLRLKLTEKYESEHQVLSSELKIKISYAAYGIIGVYIDWLRSDSSTSIEILTQSLSTITNTLFEL